jgi:hypothetical protein
MSSFLEGEPNGLSQSVPAEPLPIEEKAPTEDGPIEEEQPVVVKEEVVVDFAMAEEAEPGPSSTGRRSKRTVRNHAIALPIYILKRFLC